MILSQPGENCTKRKIKCPPDKLPQRHTEDHERYNLLVPRTPHGHCKDQRA